MVALTCRQRQRRQTINFSTMFSFIFRIFMNFVITKKVGLDCIHFFFLLNRDGLARDL